MDVLSIVSNMQRVSPEELISSQEQTESSTRYDCSVTQHIYSNAVMLFIDFQVPNNIYVVMQYHSVHL